MRRLAALALATTALAGLSSLPSYAQQSATQLDTITVQGAQEAQPTARQAAEPGTESSLDGLPPEYPGGQVATGGQLGLLGNRDIMDTPFNTSNFTARMAEDQQAVTVADVVENDPSVRSSAATGGILDAFFIRGFPIGEGNLGEVAFNGVFGVAPNYRVFTEYAERIEVLKGPSALLYGISPNGGVGGMINIVPKRAADIDITRVTTGFISEGQVGTHLDFGRRSADGRFGVRVNGSYHDGDTPLDNQSREALVGSLALDYRGERLRASLDVIGQQEKFDAPVRPYLLAAGLAVPSAPDPSINVTQPWAWSEISDEALLLSVEYDLSNNLTFFAHAGGGRTNVDRLSDQVAFILNQAGDTTTTPFYYKFDIDRETADAGLRASFDTGAVEHALTLQASAYADTLSRGSTAAAQPLQSNIYEPVYYAPIALAEPASVPKVSENDLSGIALADTLSIWGDRVQVTGGVRYQQIKSNNYDVNTGTVSSSYDDSAVTPMVGIVVKPRENVSLYANYIEGLSKGDIAPAIADNAGTALAPYVAEQKEVGVKLAFGRTGAIVSAFDITKPFGQLVGNLFTEGGEQRNRGLEFNVFGELTPAIRLLGGVTLFDAELTKTNSAATIGNRPIGVPEAQANLSVEWDTPFVEGLTLVGDVIHTGSMFVDAANTQSIPGWTRIDIGARYSTEIADRPVTFRATVLNLLDDEYWSGVAASYSGLALGAPRTVLVSMTTDF